MAHSSFLPRTVILAQDINAVHNPAPLQTPQWRAFIDHVFEAGEKENIWSEFVAGPNGTSTPCEALPDNARPRTLSTQHIVQEPPRS